MRLARRLVLLVAFAACAAGHAEVVYPPVLPGATLSWPRDAGSHPAYRVEWWYVTGWVQGDGPQRRGFQVTFFRVRTGLEEANPSRFAPTQVLFAHAALADPALGHLRHAERSARAGFGLAYAREQSVDVRLDDWSLRETAPGRYRAVVAGSGFAATLEMASTQSPMLQGEAGFSRKGPDARAASYYYSLPQLAVSGSITVDGRSQRVGGQAWFDHEWSSDYVDAAAQGWDWVGINLDGGGALMAFRMRDPRGATRWAAATLRSADGRLQSFGPGEVDWQPLRTWRSLQTGAVYPVEWRLRVGHENYRIKPWMTDAELDSRASTGTIYWEGPVDLGAEDGRPAGRGYLELTGYAGRVRM